jgi:divalent metal cation (Fe/Co/Zn/Cd) transporter
MKALENKSAVLRLQWLTVAWMTIELAVAVTAGIKARSIALVAFGGDSAVELLSAAVVLRRFYLGSDAETQATRIAAFLLYALAGFVVASSIAALMGVVSHAKSSYSGMVLLIAAAIVMPWLGRRRRALAVQTCSASLKADAVQSAVCGYLSWIALGGLALNVFFHLSWADSVAALLLVPFVLYEANEARHGKECCC